MPQGKLKVKSKLPPNVKNKKKNKGTGFTKRSSRPIQPKKKYTEEIAKLKKAITKTVNQTVEDEMRMRAQDGKKNLSIAEKAIAANNVIKKEEITEECDID